MPYYFIQITDGFAVCMIVLIWLLIIRNIRLNEKSDRLTRENNELKEKLSNLHIVCKFQEDLLKNQESNFSDGL